MPRIRLLLLCALGLVVLGVAGGIAGEAEDQMTVPMGTITLEPPETVEAKKAAVDFPHATHFVYDCKTCHHKWVPVEVIQGCQTSGCHDLDKAPEKAELSSDPTLAQRYYKKAYHSLCITCHKDIKAKNKTLEGNLLAQSKLQKSGPTGCVACHPKE